MIELTVASFPQKELVATCSVCKREIGRESWQGYSDFSRVKSNARRKHKACPFCEIATGKVLAMTGGESVWQKHVDIYGRVTKDWEAKRKKGDFLIWKEGKIWKARYRAYGSDPIMLGFSSTKENAIKRCEHSAYWGEE